jgi:hypothetical protein
MRRAHSTTRPVDQYPTADRVAAGTALSTCSLSVDCCWARHKRAEAHRREDQLSGGHWFVPSTRVTRFSSDVNHRPASNVMVVSNREVTFKSLMTIGEPPACAGGPYKTPVSHQHEVTSAVVGPDSFTDSTIT